MHHLHLQWATGHNLSFVHGGPDFMHIKHYQFITKRAGQGRTVTTEKLVHLHLLLDIQQF